MLRNFTETKMGIFHLPKKSLVGVAIKGMIGVLLCAVYIQNDTSLDKLHDFPMHDAPTRSSPNDRVKSLKIGVIGDSWVADRKLGQAIEERSLDSGLKTEVISHGHSGANSRQIYRNLYLDVDAEHSSNALLADRDLDYLVVVAGVNDTTGHVGKNFYAHHMLLIIQTALARRVTPVIVEVPEYGIEKTHSTGLITWGRRAIYRWLLDGGKVDVIREYRSALKAKVRAADIDDKVLFVNFSAIANEYHGSKHLYRNPSHLNHSGYLKLSASIVDSIEAWHRARSTTRSQ